MLKHAQLLKHKILIGLLYGCGLCCLEVRDLRLRDMDFDRRLLHIVQSKGNKDRYVPLSDHLIRGIKKYIAAERPRDYLFGGQPQDRKGDDFDSRNSQRGVQWAVKTVAKQACIIKALEISLSKLVDFLNCRVNALAPSYSAICNKPSVMLSKSG